MSETVSPKIIVKAHVVDRQGSQSKKEMFTVLYVLSGFEDDQQSNKILSVRYEGYFAQQRKAKMVSVLKFGLAIVSA